MHCADERPDEDDGAPMPKKHEMVKKDMYKLLATIPDPNQVIASNAAKRSRVAAEGSDDNDSQTSSSILR